ncbi:SCO family protein [Caldimonas sp.]|uniref:SCO family protein n=1 Tax=Caldimonas sp. TaxID=2838790 RepID=UPI00391D5D77
MQRRSLMLLGAASLVLAGCDQVKGLFGADAPRFHAIDITGAQYARNFVLSDVQGRERTMADFKGKVVAIFFGFTHCPDVCPTALLELAQVKQALGADGDKLQGIFITVDPERDTPEVMGAYVQAFDPSFVALRGSAEQTAAVAREFKVYYNKVPGKTPDSYTMDHSAGLYVFDPQGRVRLYARHGIGAEPLTQDIRRLLASG